jgi:hypothetical protein
MIALLVRQVRGWEREEKEEDKSQCAPEFGGASEFVSAIIASPTRAASVTSASASV